MKTISIVLTVHNKQELIYRVVRSILETASQDVRELIIVLDGCTDNSELEIQRAHEGTVLGGWMKRKYVVTPDVYETRANNAGVAASECDYSCLIQDDMVMRQKGFDQHLLAPLLKWPEVFAVTGRAAHNVVMAGDDAVTYTDLKGWDNRPDRNTFYIRDVINRGPIMLENERARKIGVFDEYFCPQNQDDHDLSLRGYARGWLCGSRWIDFESRLEWGTTRTKSSEFNNRCIAANMKKVIERWHYLITGPKHNEDRRL